MLKSNISHCSVFILQTQTEPIQTAASEAAAVPPPAAADCGVTAVGLNAYNLLDVSSN